MVPLARTFLRVPVSSCAVAPVAAAARTSATKSATARRTRMAPSRDARSELGFNRRNRRDVAFPAGDHRCRKAVADDVGGGAAHIEELVDAEHEQQTGFR